MFSSFYGKMIDEVSAMNIYTIIGEQTILSEKKISDILQSHHIEPFDATTYDMKESSIQDAMFDLQTVPFLSAKKAIIIRHPFFLSGKEQKTELVHEVSVLQQYLDHPTSENILIIYAPYEKLDERKKIVKTLKKVSEVHTFDVYNRQSLASWLKKKLEKSTISFDEKAIELMLTLTHEKLDLLYIELEKLEVYFLNQTDNHLTVELVNLIVPRQLEDNVFELTDAILNQKIMDAYQIYQDLLQQNEEPFKILILLANQFRLMSQLMKLSRLGYREQEMAKTLNVHPYRAKRLLQQSYRFKEQTLELYLMQLADIDYKIKTGELKKETALELFILNL